MTYAVVALPHATQRVNSAAFCERVNDIWFVCLETSNDLMFSTSDGAIWTKADDSETAHTGVVTYVGWDGTHYVRIRGGLMAYSTDLQAWTAKTSPFAVATWPDRMAWNGMNWCTSGRAESGTQYIAYATNPTGTWTKQSTGLTTTPGTTVAWFDSKWWLGSTDAIESSSNLTSWSSLAWSVGGEIKLYTDGVALFASRNQYVRQWRGNNAYWGSAGWDYLSQDATAAAKVGVINGYFAHFDTVARANIHTGRRDSAEEFVWNVLGSHWDLTSKTLSAVCHGGSAYIAFIEDAATPYQADYVTPVEVTSNKLAYFRLSGMNMTSGAGLKIGDVRLLFDGTRNAQTVINAYTSPDTGTLANLIDGSLTTTAEWTTRPDSITTNYTAPQKLNQIAIGTGDSSSKYPYYWRLDGSADGERWYRLAAGTKQRYPGTNALAQARSFFFDAADTGFDYGTQLVAKTAPTLPTLGGGNHYEPENSWYVNGYWIITFYDADTYTSTPAYYSTDLTTWTLLADAGADGWLGVWYANGYWFRSTFSETKTATTLGGTWSALPLPSGWGWINEVLGYFEGFYWLRKGTGSTSYAYSSDLVNWAFRDPTSQVQQRLPVDSAHTPYWITASGVSTSKLTAATGTGTTIAYAAKLSSEDTLADNVTVFKDGLNSYAVRSNSGSEFDYSVFRYDQTSGSFNICPSFYTHDITAMGVDAAGRFWLKGSNESNLKLSGYAALYVYTPGSVCWKKLGFTMTVGSDEWMMSRAFSSASEQMWVTFDYATNTTKVYAFNYTAPTTSLTETADGDDNQSVMPSYYATVRDGIRATTSATLQAAYNQALSESALGQVVLAAGKHFEALISEAVTGNVAAALALSARLVELSTASDVPASQAQLVVDLAEVIVALSSLAHGTTYDFLETAAANDTVAPRVTALVLLLESMLATDTPTPALTLISVVEEGGTADDTPASLLSAVTLLTEAATAGVLLRLGDDYYVGWAMNPEAVQTRNGMQPAVTQYQNFPFNSFAKLSGRYYAAASDGIYELTGSDDAGTPIVGYLKSGKLDFGSSTHKRMDSAYFAVATDGVVRLKTITHDRGENIETWYQVVSRDDGAVAENIRLKIGKGLKSRYWQFELVVEDASSFELEEFMLIPLNLTRRL